MTAGPHTRGRPVGSGLRGQLRVAYRNLARNRRRNFATGAAIALGFAALLALGGYINRVQNYLRVYTLYGMRVGHVTIYKKNGLERYALKPRDFSLTPEDQAKIVKIVTSVKDVELHGPQLLGAGLIGNGCKTLPFLATGIEPKLDQALRGHPEMLSWVQNLSHYQVGRGLWNYPEDLGGIAISEGLSRLLGKTKVHDDFKEGAPVVIVDCAAPDARAQAAADANVQLVSGSWSGMMNALDGEVVAHYNTGVTETNSQAILTSLKHLQKLYDTENVTQWSVWIKDDERLPQAYFEILAKLRAIGTDFDVYPWTDERMSPFYTGTMQFLHVLIGFLTIVLATVVVFSVFNAATMTVIERSQEIGMMRSLGYTKRGVRVLFCMEMAVLTFISIIVGGVVAILGILGVNAVNITLHPPGIAGGLPLRLTPGLWTVSGALALIIVLALATTWFAVRNVAKRNIATLLLGTQR